MCAIIHLPDSSEMYNSFPGAYFKAIMKCYLIFNLYLELLSSIRDDGTGGSSLRLCAFPK